MIFLPGGECLKVMGGSVHIKKYVRGDESQKGRWGEGKESLVEGAWLT
jgi:hypothetical protein